MTGACEASECVGAVSLRIASSVIHRALVDICAFIAHGLDGELLSTALELALPVAEIITVSVPGRCDHVPCILEKSPVGWSSLYFFRRCKKITCLYKDDVFTATDKGTAKCPFHFFYRLSMRLLPIIEFSQERGSRI